MAEQIPLFNPQSAREFLFAPSADEDKYRRGVVGVVAGSDTYPGAGLLAAFAASNTGVGMVRLNSTRRVEDLVLHYAPGVVTVGGRIQSGVIGPGCTNERYDDCRELAQFCIDSKLPLIIDAGALDLVRGLVDYADTRSRSLSRTILTPHHGEAARLLTQLGSSQSRAGVDADPAASAKELASLTGAIILLKSATTVCSYLKHEQGSRTQEIVSIPQETPWAGVAGSGDVLAGTVAGITAGFQARAERRQGNPLISEAECATLASLGAWAHAQAALRASVGSEGARPIQAIDIARALPGIIGGLCS
ncbi:ADP/ATP-dependent (S)-NAD(P)H-hydrate dehydratase [uncultured Actinomyces sp.]|uniref:ADP-dependent NAD(P)H-hydrate dehydratase n=1 Tax=uncultured Actinomyces sp. TaxID=249061 RepID=UPI0028E4B3B6|nr:ADP/ATP-dependent (S)-NAD(P)H-hydrate dehydratase [uncultured Actinomyces sp.]